MREQPVLEGQRVRLEPLAERHLAELRACANDPALWEFTFAANPLTTDADAGKWLHEALNASSEWPFAIVDKRSGAIAGSTRYLDMAPAHRKLEIGYTFIARRFWRTHVNTEAKYLMLRHAFEQWNAVRVQLKAETVNSRSREAILRLGATHEGTLRNFRIRPSDASLRDVAFYSITCDEWPAVKERLLSFLDRNLYSLSAE